MKKVMMILGVTALLASCNQKGVDKNPSLKTQLDSASYSLGLLIGSDIAQNSGEDTLVQNLIFSGLAAGFDQDTTVAIDKNEAARIWRAFLQGQQEKKMKKAQEEMAKTKEEAKKFLEENKAKAGIITTESGLQYEILKQGEGKVPQKGDKVKVHYVGTLINGTEFDSSVKRDKTYELVVGEGRVIKGWDEALQMMPTGSKWKLYIPSDLAYGDRAAGSIPAGSVLIFEVELFEILKK